MGVVIVRERARYEGLSERGGHAPEDEASERETELDLARTPPGPMFALDGESRGGFGGARLGTAADTVVEAEMGLVERETVEGAGGGGSCSPRTREA